MSALIQIILHFFGNWFFNSLCLAACSSMIKGVTLTPPEGLPAYILVMELGLILTLLNALLRPILLHLLLPLNRITVGFFSLIINGFFIFLLSSFSEFFSVSSIWVGILATFLFSMINIILQILLPIDDDVMFYNTISQKTRSKKIVHSDEKGIVMLEIDGLSYPRLLNAMEKGYMPFLKGKLDSGEYTVRPYDCGVPSQTSSCQAGIMFGRNENICAFRWYDKENHKVYSSNNPANASEIENMLFPEGKPTGILDHGISVNNIISGNAEENILTISRLLPKSKEEQKKRDRDLYLLSIRPYLLTKALILTVVDAGSEVISYWWDCIRNKEPRVNRLHKFYPFVRGATNILLREISAAMIVDAIANGRESMYTTFVGYDEIAHHSGPESTSAYSALTGIDTAIRKVFEAAAVTTARPYEIVILSDHGQTFGATFKQRYQTTLGDYIKSLAVKHNLLGKALKVVSLDKDEDNNANVMAVLNSLSSSGPGGLTRKAAETLGSAVSDDEIEKAVKEAETEANDILVLASGNLVNAYFSISEKRMTFDEIEAAYPGMIMEMLSHPGVGTVLVHTGEGPLALGEHGQRDLYTGVVTGQDPLLMYQDPDKREKQLRYLADFPNGGDLVIISPLYEDETVAAYEELIGSHGGLGGQ
ncbi:MAG: phage holin family protein, partial [Anaerolineaceae bacterium]|nr:phage holin family protein [Anaerolineaceae bacterium]